MKESLEHYEQSRPRRHHAARLATAAAAACLCSLGALAGTASAATPLSHTGDNGELQIAVTGTGLHVSAWKGSSTVTLMRATQVDVDFVEYNHNPNDGTGLEILNFYQEDIGTVRSFRNVSAPSRAINKNYPNGVVLCVESNAFSGRPCATIEG